MNIYKIDKILKVRGKRLVFLFFLWGVTPACLAQNTSFEFWPETDIWYRINPSWRLSSFIPITKYYESESRDINIYLQADYSWGHSSTVIKRRMVDQEKEQIMKIFVVRCGFMEGWNLFNSETDYHEDMLFAEIHKRTPIKRNFLVTHRFRTDSRWLGDDNDFSYRFRYRFMIEKEFKTSKNSFVPYLNIEPFWDSRYSKIVKTRAITGMTAMLSPKYALEGNLTYQYDETYNTQNLYALNVILHIFLEKN